MRTRRPSPRKPALLTAFIVARPHVSRRSAWLGKPALYRLSYVREACIVAVCGVCLSRFEGVVARPQVSRHARIYLAGEVTPGWGDQPSRGRRPKSGLQGSRRTTGSVATWRTPWATSTFKHRSTRSHARSRFVRPSSTLDGRPPLSAIRVTSESRRVAA
jgi:hypothetical protein